MSVMPIKNLASVIASGLLLAGVAVLLFGIERPKINELQAEIHDLRRTLEEREAELDKVKQNAAKAPEGAQVTSHSPHSATSVSPTSASSTETGNTNAVPSPSETTRHRASENPQTSSESRRGEWRASIVKKFLPLTEEQSARLSKRLQEDGAKRRSIAESIEEEFGKEQADFYRSELGKAFERSEQESLEKDVFYLSRKLSLSPAQEAALFAAYRDAAAPSGEATRENLANADRSANLNSVLERETKRREMLNQRFQTFLTPEQLAIFAQLEAQSSGRDLQMWHGD